MNMIKKCPNLDFLKHFRGSIARDEFSCFDTKELNSFSKSVFIVSSLRMEIGSSTFSLYDDMTAVKIGGTHVHSTR